MKFEINRAELLQLVKAAKLGQNKKRMTSIENFLLVSADGDQVSIMGINLAIMGINLETFVKATGCAKVSQSGVLGVDSDILLNIAKGGAGDTVVFEMMKHGVKATCGMLQQVIPTTQADDFPETWSVDDVCYSALVAESDLLKAFSQVRQCVADSHAKPVLQGVNIIARDGKLEVNGLDGYVLASANTKAFGNMNAVIPVGAVNAFEKLADKKSKSQVEINANTKHANIRFRNIEISTRILDGDYPQVKQFIPKLDSATVITVDVKQFLGIVNRAYSVSDHKKKNVVVSMNITGQSIQFSTRIAGSLTAYQEAILQVVGQDMTACYSADYLCKLLKTSGLKMAKLHLTGQYPLMVITPVDDDKYLSLVMPQRITA